MKAVVADEGCDCGRKPVFDDPLNGGADGGWKRWRL